MISSSDSPSSRSRSSRWSTAADMAVLHLPRAEGRTSCLAVVLVGNSVRRLYRKHWL